MATYQELYDLYSNAALRNRVSVACVVAADAIRQEDAGVANHAARLAWAKQVFIAPDATAESMLKAVLAANKALSVAQITGAADAALQTAVSNAVNIFATGA